MLLYLDAWIWEGKGFFLTLIGLGEEGKDFSPGPGAMFGSRHSRASCRAISGMIQEPLGTEREPSSERWLCSGSECLAFEPSFRIPEPPMGASPSEAKPR